MDLRRNGSGWRFVKASICTVIVFGTFVVFVPYIILVDASLGNIDVLGISLLGVLPVILGTTLYLRSTYDFILAGKGAATTVLIPSQLALRGPYQYCRNPMYVGVIAVLAGEALLYRDILLFYFLLILAVSFHLFVIFFEERIRRRESGESYSSYCAAVPRWIPAWSALEALYRKTFLKVGTLVLVAGTVAHALRLTVGLPILEMPISIHAFLVVLPAYATVGCIIYARQINLYGLGHKLVFAMIIVLLAITAVMHLYSIVAHDNQWQSIFPMWYSVVAFVVYGGFAHFLKTRKLV